MAVGLLQLLVGSLALITLACHSIAAAAATCDLYLVALGPFPDKNYDAGWDRGPTLIAAARLARDHINNRSDILSGYTLHLLEGDSGCALEWKARIRFVEHVLASGKQVVGIIGPACSDATRAVATLGARDELSLLQIATGTSPELVNDAYTNTFRSVSSSLVYVDVFRELMKYNKWERVAAVYQGDRFYFKTTYVKFEAEVNVIFSTPVYDTDFTFHGPLEEIRQNQVRVIFSFMGNAAAKKTLCLAYHLDLIFPTYQWVFHDRGLYAFTGEVEFFYDGMKYSCSASDMATASHGIILNNYRLTRTGNDTTDLNITYKEFTKQHQQKLKQIGKELNQTTRNTPYANLYYDAVWSLAFSLNRSIPLLEENNLHLLDYTYGHPNTTAIIRDQLLELEFQGISGPIMFQNTTRDSLTVIDVNQVWSNGTMNELVNIGNYSNYILKLVNVTGRFVNDSFSREQVRVHLAAATFVLLLTFTAFTLTLILQLTNVVYYNFRPIKATSPNLNQLIFSGCYLIVIAALAFVLQETFISSTGNPIEYSILCNAFAWCLVMGYSLIFGTMCAKMWRVYRIWHQFKSRHLGFCITDQGLVGFVIMLLFLDVTIMLLWNLTDPWLLAMDETYEETGSIPVIKIRATCQCKNLNRWIGLMVMYKGLVTVAVVCLSILNRNVHRKDFKHSKNVNVLVYLLAMVIGVAIPLYFILLKLDIHISFFILSILLNAIIILCCAFLFFPPVLRLLEVKLNITPANLYESTRRSSGSLLNIITRRSSFS